MSTNYVDWGTEFAKLLRLANSVQQSNDDLFMINYKDRVEEFNNVYVNSLDKELLKKWLQ